MKSKKKKEKNGGERELEIEGENTDERGREGVRRMEGGRGRIRCKEQRR